MKTKKDPKKAEKDIVNQADWNTCKLTNENLSEPIVVDKIGYLYNKTSLLEHLLDKKKRKKNSELIGHIGGLSDLYDAILEKNPKYSEEGSSNKSTMDKTAVSAHGISRFICPVTSEELRGQFPVYLITTCGHVISGKALELANTDGFCMLCEKPFSPQETLLINPPPEVASTIREQLLSAHDANKKRKNRSENKDKKKKKKTQEIFIPENADSQVYKSIFASSTDE